MTHHLWMRTLDEAAVIREVIERLNATYADVPAPDIAALVNSELAHFDDSKIRELVPLFVERRSRAKLSARQPVLSWST